MFQFLCYTHNSRLHADDVGGIIDSSIQLQSDSVCENYKSIISASTSSRDDYQGRIYVFEAKETPLQKLSPRSPNKVDLLDFWATEGENYDRQLYIYEASNCSHSLHSWFLISFRPTPNTIVI